ncbi:InlB B-repeat-containing protein, partial [Paenibacillus sp. TAF58]
MRAVQLFVDYDGNGNTGGTPPIDSNTYSSGVTANVYSDAVDLVRTGYTFAGWNTLADGSGISYGANDGFKITGDTTLYAKWLKREQASEPSQGGGGAPSFVTSTDGKLTLPVGSEGEVSLENGVKITIPAD